MEKAEEKAVEYLASIVNDLLYKASCDEARLHFIENLNICLDCGKKLYSNPDGIGFRDPCFCKADE